MTVSTAVKWAVSSMTGAPTLNGTAGSLIAVLDAFLVNGFGTKAVDSAQVTSGVCRLAITGGSAAQDHCVIQLAGVTGDGLGLNGLQRVKAATASYVEFACDLPDGTLTGTITFKIAPLGWEKVFSKTNVAVYRPLDPSGSRPFVRVDDTNALFARVMAYEHMSDVDTGLGLMPLSATVSGGYYWHKRQAAAATGVFWALIGDSRGFYICPAPASTTTAATAAGYAVIPQYVGDANSYRSGDAWGVVLTGALSATYSAVDGDVMQSGAAGGRSLMRASHGIGGAIPCTREVWGATGVSGLAGGLGPFPSRVDNGLRLSPIVLSDGVMGADGPRGELPGAYHCPQTGVAANLAMGSVRDGEGVFAGRKLLVLHCGSPAASSGQGAGFFDITGPWRS